MMLVTPDPPWKACVHHPPDARYLEILLTIKMVCLNCIFRQIIKDFLETMDDRDTFASDKTIPSIRITLQSILDLVDYLCGTLGFTYVLTAKFNQDCLEVSSCSYKLFHMPPV